MKLNMANKLYVVFATNRPPKQNINFFIDRLSKGLHFYWKDYENICIPGDFNARLSNPNWTLFLKNQNLKKLVKYPTHFN